MQRYRVVIMLVLFGVVPVVAAFFVALSFLGEQEVEPQSVQVPPIVEEEESPPPETRTVLAAARDLPVGTLLGEDDLSELALEVSAVESGYIVSSDDSNTRSYRGYAVRKALAGGGGDHPIRPGRSRAEGLSRHRASPRHEGGDGPRGAGDESGGAHRSG